MNTPNFDSSNFLKYPIQQDINDIQLDKSSKFESESNSLGRSFKVQMSTIECTPSEIAKKSFETIEEKQINPSDKEIKAKKIEATQEIKDYEHPKDYVKVGAATVIDSNGFEVQIDVMEKAIQGKLRTYIACHQGKELGFITFHKVSLPNDFLIPQDLLKPFAQAVILDDNYGSAKMMYYESQVPDLSDKIYVKNFGSTRSQNQIKGIGTALMQAVYETSKNERCKGKIILDASGDSPVFYYKLGLRAMIGNDYKKACDNNEACRSLNLQNKRKSGGDFMMYLPHSAMKAWDDKAESKPILIQQQGLRKSQDFAVPKETVNLQDQYGNTPLHQIIQKIYIRDDHYDEIRELIENGADLTIQNHNGKTALEMCFDQAGKGNLLPLTTLLLLLKPEQKVSFFQKHYDASLPDQLKICFVQIFDEQPQDCLYVIQDFPEETCNDLMHTLAKYSSRTASKAVDSEGNTLAHYACKYLSKSLDVMLFLNLEDINLQNKAGKTPSDMASKENIQKFMGRVMENPEDYF